MMLNISFESAGGGHVILEWNISVSSCILILSLLICNGGCCFLLRAAVQSDS